MRASSESRERQAQTIGNRHIAARVLAGVLRNVLTDPVAPRSHFLTNIWIELKRYGAREIPNIELSRIRGIDRVHVDGPVRRHSPMVVTALSILLESETVFEFGPDTGDTASLLARNLANANIYRVDEGAESPKQANAPPANPAYPVSREDNDPRHDAVPPASRITRLTGDSTSFDVRPYSGTADLVYIEGSRRHARIRSDTEAAFGLLSELGTVVWDGYLGDAGVYAYLNELAPSLDGPLFHILGTRLVFYSRWDIVIPDPGSAAVLRQPAARRDP
jgi:hypothetical protein